MREIVILTQYFYPDLASTAQLMTDLAQGLASHNYVVKVFTSSKSESYPVDDNFPEQVEIVHQSSQIFGNRTIVGKALNSLLFLASSLIYLTTSVSKQTPILLVSNPPYIGIVGLFFKLLKQGKFYFLIQDIFPESAVLSKILKSRGLLYTIFSYLTYLTCKYSQATITLTISMKEFLETKYPDLRVDRAIKVIENWSIENIKVFSKEKNEFAIEHHITNNFTLLYSGNIGRLHDIESIAIATQILRNKPIKFVFIGDGAKKKLLESYQKEYQLNNILLLPFQPRESLSQSLTACDVSLVSLVEGADKIMAPCKLYGMLAAGRAILAISSPGSYIDRLLTQYQCGVNCSPHNPQQLANTITLLASDPRRVQKMGEKARQLYEENYTFDRALNEYEKILFGS
jgi:glycosyltransferase involved in cell wall biosynthesis